MSKPSFTVFVGIKGEFSKEDFAKLPLNLRKAYSQCPEWDPGEEIRIRGLEFDSFDLGRDDNADPGEYVGFGVRVFGHWYDSGATNFDLSEFQAIKSVCQKMTALFKQWKLDAKVKVFCFAGYNS